MTTEPLRFIPMGCDEWQAKGLPPKSTSYDYAAKGRLNLTNLCGKTGVTNHEAQRFLAAEIKPYGGKREQMRKARAARKAR